MPTKKTNPNIQESYYRARRADSIPCQDNLGLKERSGNAFGDRQQLALPAEDTNCAGTAEFREVHRRSVLNLGKCVGRGGDGGKLRQHQPGMNEQILSAAFLCRLLDLIQGVGFVDGELAHCGALQGGKVGAGAEFLAEIVSQGAEIGSGADPGGKTRGPRSGVPVRNHEFLDLDLAGVKLYFFSLTRQFVGGNAGDLLRGKGWGQLSYGPSETAGGVGDFFQGEANRLLGPPGIAFGVVGDRKSTR